MEATRLAVGIVVIVIGTLLALAGAVRPSVSLYVWISSRAAACWGEQRRHAAMIAYGALMATFGVLILAGVIPLAGKR